MADIVIPAALRHARNSFRYIDSTGATRAIYTGAAQTTGYGGDRVAATIDFTPHGMRSAPGKSERAQLQAFLMSLRGKQNRVYVADESNDTSQGSFPAVELFANTDFDGSTGWTAGGSSSLTASDRALRLAATAGGGAPTLSQTIGLTAFAPHVLRAFVADGRGTSGINLDLQLSLGSGFAITAPTTTRGYFIASGVPVDATARGQFPLYFPGASGYGNTDYATLSFASLSRCFQADGAGNLLTKSDEFEHANWQKFDATGLSNQVASPDGATTGDAIRETATTAAHYVLQAGTVGAGATDVTFSVACRPGLSRDWAVLRMSEGTGSTQIYQTFNITTGALGSTNSTGANWANLRATIKAMGNGWYLCTLTGRKTNAATSISAWVGPSNADSVSSYAGNTANGIYVFRGALWTSSVPMRGIQSTTTAVATDSQTGSSIHVKGLPASTDDLLKVGRWIEIDGQLKMVTAPLNSDAAGLGYLQFSPPLRRALADNTPIIVHRPMGRFLFAGEHPGWDNEPGVISVASIDLEEAFP